MNLHVGNLPPDTNDTELRRLFAQCGKIVELEIIKNARTGEPLGYAFIVMESDEAGECAIEALDQTTFKGREITVQMAKRPDGKRNTSGTHRPRQPRQ